MPELIIIAGANGEVGHPVPEEDIKRRFSRSLNNFWDYFSLNSDKLFLYYNGEMGFQECAAGDLEKYNVTNEVLFSKFISLKIKNEKS